MASGEFSSRTCYFEPITSSVANKAELASLLEPWATVIRVTIPTLHTSAAVKGYAFIQLESESQMQTVCRALAPNKVHTTMQGLAKNENARKKWKGYFSDLRTNCLPALMVLPHSTWASRKQQWSSAQSARREENDLRTTGCLARVWGLPPDGLPHAALRSRLAEFGRVAYLDYPGSIDSAARHTYPPAPLPRSTATTHAPQASTPVPKIPPGQAIVRFLSAQDRSDALHCCRLVPLVVARHTLHLLPVSSAEEREYIHTAAAKQAAHSPALAQERRTQPSAPAMAHPPTSEPSTAAAASSARPPANQEQHHRVDEPSASIGGHKRARSGSPSPGATASKRPAPGPTQPGASAQTRLGES